MKSNLTSILKLIFILLFFSQVYHSKAQQQKRLIEYAIGSSYNFQTKGIAFEARGKINIYKSFYITPRISYFPSFNKIHEFYAGADLNYFFFDYKSISPYLILGGYYNNWINNKSFHSPLATKNNFAPEGGAGLLFNIGCFNPYIEYRYDRRWKEGIIGIGILIGFDDCFSNKNNSEIRCPRF